VTCKAPLGRRGFPGFVITAPLKVSAQPELQMLQFLAQLNATPN